MPGFLYIAQVLVFAPQALYQLSHPPVPRNAGVVLSSQPPPFCFIVFMCSVVCHPLHETLSSCFLSFPLSISHKNSIMLHSRPGSRALWGEPV